MKWSNPSTQLCHDGESYSDHHGAIVPPLYQNSLFAFKSWEELEAAFDNKSTSYLYSRLMNPSVELVEKKIARLCGGEKAKLMASGMGAIAAAVLSCVRAGDHIVTVDSVYGPANSFMGTFLRDKCDISVSYIRGAGLEEWENAVTDRTRLFYLESPTSMNFDLQPIEAVVRLARSKGIKTIIDNTWASPLFQQPLKVGVDLEIHSVSKYLGGHSDLVAGVIVGQKKDIEDIVVRENAFMGAKIAPFEAWLVMRSLRTLTLRMDRHQSSAMEVASFLYDHKNVRQVKYPGLPGHPQYALATQQMQGFSGLLSFELDTNDPEVVKSFVNALQLFKIGVSWGGHESLVYSPIISYSRELSASQFAAMKIEVGLLRISVGLENVLDLIDDLNSAFENAF